MIVNNIPLNPKCNLKKYCDGSSFKISQNYLKVVTNQIEIKFESSYCRDFNSLNISWKGFKLAENYWLKNR